MTLGGEWWYLPNAGVLVGQRRVYCNQVTSEIVATVPKVAFKRWVV